MLTPDELDAVDPVPVTDTRAEAWDDGFQQGRLYQRESASIDVQPERPRNPFRMTNPGWAARIRACHPHPNRVPHTGLLSPVIPERCADCGCGFISEPDGEQQL